jgi:PAS domain S-box-containing protein
MTVSAVNKALDLDLAIIQHAFETEQLRRKTEAARLRSEIRFRNLVEAATCMIVILREDGRVLYFSPFAEMLTGCSPNDIQGTDYFQRCIPAEYVEQARTSVLQLSEGESVHSMELPVVGREGKMHWLAWNARRIEDMDERPVVLLVGHDITERKLAESRLVQAERLAAIGQMITGLAHESRNALQRINASTEMLEFEVEGNPQALELVHRSQKALDDIHRLFDEVRNYAAPIHLERSRLSLAAVWREAWELLVHLRRHRDVTLTEHLVGTEPVALVDRFRMVQVFRNLLENSLSACADPVRVVIACRTIHLGEELAQEVWLADSGPGFTQEARREALHPFFTTKTKGTGLGLAIVQRLVHAHGGIVELMGRDECPAEWRSEMTGAIVRIVLPTE